MLAASSSRSSLACRACEPTLPRMTLPRRSAGRSSVVSSRNERTHGYFRFGLRVRGRGAAAAVGETSPFRLLLIGNFSERGARANEGRPPLRRPLVLDAGEVEQAPRALRGHAVRRGSRGAPGSGTVRVDGRLPSCTARSRGWRHSRCPGSSGRRWRLLRRARIRLPPSRRGCGAWPRRPLRRAPPRRADRVRGVDGGDARAFAWPCAGAPARRRRRPRADRATGAINDCSPKNAVKGHVTPDVGARRTALLSVVDGGVDPPDARAPRDAALPGARGAVARCRSRGARAGHGHRAADRAAGRGSRRFLAAALPAPGGDLEASPLHRLLVADEPRGWSLIAVETPFDRTPGVPVAAGVAGGRGGARGCGLAGRSGHRA